MNLVQSADGTGRYVDAGWDGSTPGLFAVVIGVSRYHHQDRLDSFGMAALGVSATTAFEFFRWLAADYRGNCPVVSCHLLLAPTEEERRVIPGLAGAAPDATFAACAAGIKAWRRAMRGLAPAVARASRAVFFFSGHGLEVTTGHQVLLPADYLAEEQPDNDAIGTSFLLDGLADLAVPHHLCFVDACRNDNAELRRWHIEGRVPAST